MQFLGNFDQIIGWQPPLFGVGDPHWEIPRIHPCNKFSLQWPPLGNWIILLSLFFFSNLRIHLSLYIFLHDFRLIWNSVPNRLKLLQYVRVNNIRAAAFLEFSAQRNSRCYLNEILSGRGGLAHFHNLLMMRITTYIHFNHCNNPTLAFEHEIRTYNEWYLAL